MKKENDLVAYKVNADGMFDEVILQANSDDVNEGAKEIKLVTPAALSASLYRRVFIQHDEPVAPQVGDLWIVTEAPVITPLTRLQVVMTEENKIFKGICGNGELDFPEFIPSEWGDDLLAYLTTLGSFQVNWGDGSEVEAIPYTVYASDGLTHTYASAGAYEISIFSPYCLTYDCIYITEISNVEHLVTFDLYNNSIAGLPDFNLSVGLKFICVSFCQNLQSANLEGLSQLKRIDIENNEGLSSVNLSGLTALTFLFLYNNALLSTVDLTGLFALQTLNISLCNFSQEALDNVLITLTNEAFSQIENIDLTVLNDVAPTYSVVAAFQAAHPSASVITN